MVNIQRFRIGNEGICTSKTVDERGRGGGGERAYLSDKRLMLEMSVFYTARI